MMQNDLSRFMMEKNLKYFAHNSFQNEITYFTSMLNKKVIAKIQNYFTLRHIRKLILKASQLLIETSDLKNFGSVRQRIKNCRAKNFSKFFKKILKNFKFFFEKLIVEFKWL